MFDAQCDLAALVYEQDQDPDAILREFATELNGRGYRAVGIVQLGHHCLDAGLSAMLVHTGEELQLFQDLGSCSAGCRLDVGQLLDAGQQIASAIDQGADLLIKFADGMSVKLHCDRESLDAWWQAVSSRNAGFIEPAHTTVCEAFK
jgi:hypothetical protein